MINPFNEIEERLNNIENLITELKNKPNQVEQKAASEQLLTVQEAAQFLNLTVPTIYSKVSKRELPVMKRGKRLYFSNIELMEYLKGGKRKSNAELEDEAKAYLSNNKKALKNRN
ncbi:helix-turn-helix domain-containing protein [Flavobacteriales bacterium]|nr:helix-turn-helix domain-containing protein [Flavobacteriales bacterium]